MLHQNYHCTPNRQKILTALTQNAGIVSLSTLGLATGLKDMEIRVALRKLAVAGVVEYSEAEGWVKFELH